MLCKQNKCFKFSIYKAFTFKQIEKSLIFFTTYKIVNETIAKCSVITKKYGQVTLRCIMVREAY